MHGQLHVRQHGATHVRDDVRLLTYDEIAELFGIERESARHLALRKNWRRTKGNDGKARVEVPLEAVPSESKGGSTPNSTGEDTAATPALVRHIERLEAALETAQQRFVEAEAARDAACDEARAMERDRNEALATSRVITARVDALNTILAVERERAEAERARVEEWKAVSDRFASQAETLAEAAQARHGWWSWRRAS
jgi:DNA primase